MGTGGTVQGTRHLLRLRALEGICLGLAALSAVAQFAGTVVVIGHNVLTPWSLSGYFLIAWLIVRLISARASRGRTIPPLTPGVDLLRAVAVVALSLICVGSALFDVSARYSVLDPSSDEGCRAVVREDSFLLGGNGNVYVARPFGFIATQAGSWRTDDGYRPVAAGAYAVKWKGNSGLLLLRYGGDPVWPSLHTIDCG